jgi:hypothetical protein
MKKNINQGNRNIDSFYPIADFSRLSNVNSIAARALKLSAISILLYTGSSNAQLPADTTFISSAVENLDGTVTFPAYTGTSGGQTVYFVMTESSDAAFSAQYGLIYAPKLRAFAPDTHIQYQGVQDISSSAPPFNFPATVTFNAGARGISPATGVLSPTPSGVAPAVGAGSYSPLIRLLPSGIVVNAPHVQNNTGRHPKLRSFDTATSRKATLLETSGFQGGQPVRYVSTDASTQFLAAAENSTYAPWMANLQIAGHADLALIDDGQRGIENIENQGFDSALLDGLDPLNILAANPSDTTEYSPIWGVNPLQWNVGAPVRRLRDLNIARASAVTPLTLSGRVGELEPVVNCPIVARRSTSNSSVTPKLSNFYVSNRVNGSSSNSFTVTAVVVDGANGDTPLGGVLVGIQNITEPASCITNGSGICTASRNIRQGESERWSVITLNRARNAPGIRNFSATLVGPPGPAL